MSNPSDRLCALLAPIEEDDRKWDNMLAPVQRRTLLRLLKAALPNVQGYGDYCRSKGISPPSLEEFDALVEELGAGVKL